MTANDLTRCPMTEGPEALRRAVIQRYARPTRSTGRPMFCTPSDEELATGERPKSKGKVIYDTRSYAEAAARELEALGAWPMRVYRCDRSRHGHYHLGSLNRDARLATERLGGAMLPADRGESA